MFVYFVVESACGSKMLSESVVGHEEFVFDDVGEHAVWPVEHGCFEELEGSFSQFEFVAVLDCFYFEVWAVMFDDGVFSSFGGNYGCVFGEFGDYGRLLEWSISTWLTIM